MPAVAKAKKTSTPIEQGYGTGRRKSSTARVFLRAGKGEIIINNKTLEDYFGRDTSRMVVRQPLRLLSEKFDIDPAKFDIYITVKGGGISGQAGAIRHGMTRAFMAHKAELRPALKAAGFVTRDDRKVERKKPGFRKARKKEQYSKR